MYYRRQILSDIAKSGPATTRPLTKCWFYIGSASLTLAQHETSFNTSCCWENVSSQCNATSILHALLRYFIATSSNRQRYVYKLETIIIVVISIQRVTMVPVEIALCCACGLAAVFLRNGFTSRILIGSPNYIMFRYCTDRMPRNRHIAVIGEQIIMGYVSLTLTAKVSYLKFLHLEAVFR